jgi:hypothetical protein
MSRFDWVKEGQLCEINSIKLYRMKSCVHYIKNSYNSQNISKATNQYCLCGYLLPMEKRK